VAERRKRSRLSEAFSGVASRTGGQAESETEDFGTSQKPDTPQIEMVPGRGGKPVPANTLVNMTFTVSAKERYEWTLEVKRRGLSSVSVLRRAMNELLEDDRG
jgi:hypothetical protein